MCAACMVANVQLNRHCSLLIQLQKMEEYETVMARLQQLITHIPSNDMNASLKYFDIATDPRQFSATKEWIAAAKEYIEGIKRHENEQDK